MKDETLINKKTVFVIGAGASKEVNLPIGSELTKAIAEVLNFELPDPRQGSGDKLILEALQIAYNASITPPMYACLAIREAMPLAISIDNFIDTHSGNKIIEFCGKLAIVRTILQAEENSKLYSDYVDTRTKGHINFNGLANTWFKSFLQLITENCDLKKLENRLSSIVLIIFNYDRCVEHFLYDALQVYYGIIASDAAALIKRIKIYHPYGMVGSLPWLNKDKSIDFGSNITPEQLLKSVTQIKTFTEGTDQKSSDIIDIRGTLSMADRIVFLGFAFHSLNLDLLFPKPYDPNFPLTTRHIFATAYGISASGTDSILAEFRQRGFLQSSPRDFNNNFKCNDLFIEYWRSLSFN